MFDFLGDVAKGIGSIVGAVAGPIIGLSFDVIAGTLNITTSMVKEAIDSGCKTYEDIKDFHDL